MNTFWLKVAGVAIGIFVVIILAAMFTSGDNQRPEPPEQPQRTIYDQAEEDKQKFLAKPEEVVPNQQQTPPNRTTQPAQQPVTRPQRLPEPVQLYFKELDEIDKIQAEQLLNVAVPGRSIGRLPMTGYNLMVDNCRQIIRKWPDSYYAYQAHRLFADLPERYKQRYKVTEEEMDISRFTKPRPGTKPFTIKETR
jgi:type IV secretory pathway VirB10-like protein